MEFYDIRSDINSLFSLLRRFVERPQARSDLFGRFEPAISDRSSYLKVMRLIENARIDFASYDRNPFDVTQAEWAEARAGVLAFLSDFLQSPDVPSDFLNKVILGPNLKMNIGRFRIVIDTRRPVEEYWSLRGVLKKFHDVITQAEIGGLGVAQGTIADLKDLVPEQQVAAAQFEIIDNKIFVSRSNSAPYAEDRDSADHAWQHIRQSGEALLSALEGSNCDPRLLSNVRELHKKITLNDNVIQIGLANIGCDMMVAEYRKELPDAVCAQFNSYSVTISMYVGQFPEWERFLSNAAHAQLDDDDIYEVGVASSEVLQMLEKNPQLADPEVPETIKFVQELMSQPGKSSKRAAFAMIRTIENMVSCICKFVATTAEKASEKASEKISDAIAYGSYGLLGLALIGASGIGGPSGQLGVNWAAQTAEFIQRQLSKD